jgi:hypothetical protein
VAPRPVSNQRLDKLISETGILEDELADTVGELGRKGGEGTNFVHRGQNVVKKTQCSALSGCRNR